MVEITKELSNEELLKKMEQDKIKGEIEKYEKEVVRCSGFVHQKELDDKENQKNIMVLEEQQKAIKLDIKFYNEKKNEFQNKVKELKKELEDKK